MSAPRRFQVWLRRLHIYAGLQACAGLAVFAAVTLAATQRDPIGSLRPPVVQQHRVSLPPEVLGARDAMPAEALALAVTAALELGPVQGPWLPRWQGHRLSFLLGGPAGERTISYDPRAGQVTETLTPASPGEQLVYLHQVRPPLVGYVDPWLVAMGLFNLVCVASLGLLAVSGVVLFASGAKRPAYAWATLLVATSVCAAALWGG